jgi:hypothetical protein
MFSFRICILCLFFIPGVSKISVELVQLQFYKSFGWGMDDLYTFRCFFFKFSSVAFSSGSTLNLLHVFCRAYFNSSGSEVDSIGNCNSKQNNHHWWGMGVLWWFCWPCFECLSFLIFFASAAPNFHLLPLLPCSASNLYPVACILVEVAQMLWISQAAASVSINVDNFCINL